jgi:TetR/AcrR family transcriptional regulator, transcriptional repressor for nem operon
MLRMRRTNDQKAETRQHIVEAAGRLFRQHGIDAVGVDAIMHAAGLTHGGFYGHFPSKEALVAEVADASLARGAVGANRAG